jgi:hypothetical protein
MDVPRPGRIRSIAAALASLAVAASTEAAAVGPDWLLAATPTLPAARESHAMAYDSSRGRVVMFGTFPFGAFPGERDTWEWDGKTWIRAVSPTMPAARSEHAMAYDSLRGRVVMFGGQASTTYDDTWEWNGSSWVERTPPVSPPPRSGHAMAYDIARGRVVLFGGTASGGANLGDTWEWDGASWTQRMPAASPSPRAYHAMVYDAVRGRTVLFGGSVGGFAVNETWEWDGTTWVRQLPAGGLPAPRSRHAMAYDGGRGRTVLYGGASFTGSNHLGDLWEWNGTAWAQRIPSPSPLPRYNHDMAYDSVRGHVVLFGGRSSTLWPLGDTWEWDGSTWFERTAAAPVERDSPALAHDGTTGRSLLFGGSRIEWLGSATWTVRSLGDTWEWDGATWALRTPAISPSARSGHAMVHDSARGRTVLFGGRAGTNVVGDTWEWNGAGNTWTERTPAFPIPQSRFRHAMAYDAQRQTVVLFGGHTTGTDFGDTWEWNGTAWTSASSSGPSARSGHAMVYDAARGRVVLFGGNESSGDLSDTWEWDGSSWNERTPASGPSARHGHSLAYDTARGRVVLFGGRDATGLLDDTWEWDGSAWVEVHPVTTPSPRELHAMVYDAGRQRIVLCSGDEAYPFLPSGETWEYGAIEGCGHAAAAIAFAPGSGTDDTSGLAALGAPDAQAVSLGVGGSLVLRLAEPVQNRTGADLVVHESASDAGGIDESFRVEVSADGLAFTFARDCAGNDCQIDLGGTSVTRASYVRLTDLPPDEGSQAPDAGADIDGVSVLACAGALELCNGIDDDGDASVPSDEADPDGDGWVACTPWSGAAPGIVGGGDCVPGDPTVHPGAPELCDGVDNDCLLGGAANGTNLDADGFRVCAGDCDDRRPTVYPEAPELCDGLPNDCHSAGWPTLSPAEANPDGDAYMACQGDCNDLDPAVYPGAAETCNGTDDDCDGRIDGKDLDDDGVREACDNCPSNANPSQLDTDDDALGDACDACAFDAANDADHDGACGDVDNCPTPNPAQQDTDEDGRGDACDNCVSVPNLDQLDSDGEIVTEWAYSAVASSQYSSGDYSAAQAAGPPESAGVCADVPTNWSPLTPSIDPEWIELFYSVPLRAFGVDVHEAFGERFVKQIELAQGTGPYSVAWRATDATTCGDALEARFALTPTLVDRVLVRTAAPDWEEIDSVALVGVYSAHDQIGDACDNCPQRSNPSQADVDEDGAGDTCDCAITDASTRPAAEVEGLVVERRPAGVLRLRWDAAEGADSYAIVRSELHTLSATHVGECHIAGLGSLIWDDAAVPAPGRGFGYLVRGDDDACGPGTLGVGAYGVARVPVSGACPE